ncbi:MAG: hypothetical protein HYX39_00265 [Bacteroidetes bacterium]|nr:hypothetical protein [Bacteroidota bacterium]
MLKRVLYFVIAALLSTNIFSQAPAQDTIFLMNGHVVAQKVIDTLLGAVTILNPQKPLHKINYELEQLYMVKFSNGHKRFYYQQDSTINNWFTRNEMWMFMKGETDARKGFKAKGSLIGAGVAGVIGGMTGTFWAPVLPYAYMALVGIPKVKIRHETISNPIYIESDAYILGYERVARHKRRIQAVIGGTVGLAVGFSLYGLLHQYYPETINIGFSR